MPPLLLLLSSALLQIEAAVGLEPPEHDRLGAAAESALRSVERSEPVRRESCGANCGVEAAKIGGDRRIIRLKAIGGPTRIRALISEIDPQSGAQLAATTIDLPRGDPSAWPALLAPGMGLATTPAAASEDHTTTVLQLGLLGAGAVAIVTGALLGRSSADARDALLQATDSEATRDLGDRAATEGTWATVLIGAGSGAVLAGVVWLAGGEP